MEPKPIKIIFKEADAAGDITLEQLLDELVKDTVNRIVAKYEHLVFHEEQ